MEKQRELGASAKRVIYFQEKQKREGTGDRAEGRGGSHN